MAKKDGRSFSHEQLEVLRKTAIKLHREGVAVSNIARSMGVNVDAVYKWIRKASQYGLGSLKSTKALGPSPKLTKDQHIELIKILKSPATKHGYATDLWTGTKVRHLLKHKFGIKYHEKHIPRLLRRLGLVLKFPERRALEQDEKKVRCWKKHKLPLIIAKARKKGALVFYADESLISLIPYVGKTWTFPKARPVVRVSGKRGEHIGVTAAVNKQGRICFELTKEGERFISEIFIRFIKKMRKEYPGKAIVLIVDGAPVHKSKKVKEFTANNSSWLTIEILPAYSPELNPTEQTWRHIKTKKLNGSTARNMQQLREETKRAMSSLKKTEKVVEGFFKNK